MNPRVIFASRKAVLEIKAFCHPIKNTAEYVWKLQPGKILVNMKQYSTVLLVYLFFISPAAGSSKNNQTRIFLGTAEVRDQRQFTEVKVDHILSLSLIH